MRWINEVDLTAAERAEIAALLPRSFGVDFPGGDFFLHPQHLRLLMQEHGTLVGHLAITLRTARIGEALTTFAGVGDFAVSPEAQGAGIGRRMTGEAVRHMRTLGVPLMLLFGNSGMYHRAGFIPAENPLIHPDILPEGTRGVYQSTKHDLMAQWLDGRDWDHSPRIDLLSAHF